MKLLFTFHNVSINSKNVPRNVCEKKNLHSTMFLLIRVRELIILQSNPKFTFHNVSINSELEAQNASERINLHSTMFLLIR